PETARVSRLLIVPAPAQAVIPDGQARSIAISPDGTRIAYAAGDVLFLRELQQFEPVPIIRDDSSPTAPFFSSDGQSVGYFQSNRALRSVRADVGGTASVIATLDSWLPRGAASSPDGTLVFATS